MRRSPGRSSGSSKMPRLGALVLLAAFITFANYAYYHKVCPPPCDGRLDSPSMHAATQRANVDGPKLPAWRLVDNRPAAVRPHQNRARGKIVLVIRTSGFEGELEARVGVNNKLLISPFPALTAQPVFLCGVPNPRPRHVRSLYPSIDRWL